MTVKTSDDISTDQARFVSWTSGHVYILECHAAVASVELIHTNPGTVCADCERRPRNMVLSRQAHDATHAKESHERDPHPGRTGKSQTSPPATRIYRRHWRIE